VLREDGVLIQMDKLKVGDSILAYNPNTGEQEFSEIIAWLHRDPSAYSSYIGIQAQSDILWVSAQHNVAILADETVKYIHAGDIVLGNKLISNGNNSTVVHSIKSEMLYGVYAPYTRLANFYVGTTNATYLAHSFAYIRHPVFYECLFAASMRLAEYINPSVHIVEDVTSHYLHPVARTLQKIFPFVVDIPTSTTRKPSSRNLQLNNFRYYSTDKNTDIGTLTIPGLLVAINAISSQSQSNNGGNSGGDDDDGSE